MFEKYKQLPWGERTQYKKDLATYLGLTMSTVNLYIVHGHCPKDHVEKVEKFNEKYFK